MMAQLDIINDPVFSAGATDVDLVRQAKSTGTQALRGSEDPRAERLAESINASA
jgi:hypothetical protein